MTLIHHNTTTDRSSTRLRDSIASYLVRYRLGLFLLLGTSVAAIVALNWNWLAAAGLLPILAFLPCIVMMFMCMNHGTRSHDDLNDEPTKMPPR